MFSFLRLHRFRLYKNLLLVVASGILQILVFPKFSLGWVSWISLVPLLLVLYREVAWPRAFFLGWVFGLTFFSGSCYWILAVLESYGDMHWSVSFLLFTLLVAYLSLFPALFACAFSKLSLQFPAFCFLIVPFLWVSTEYLRGHVLTGFPWCFIGYALVDEIPLLKIATFTGVYGLSFLVVLINSLLVGVFFRSKAANGCLPVMLVILGFLIWMEPEPIETGDIKQARARLVQTDIPLDQPFDPQSQSRLLEELIDLSRESAIEIPENATGSGPISAKRSNVRLIIWPETPAPFYYHEDSSFRTRMNELAHSSGASLLFGFVDWPKKTVSRTTGPFNSVGTVTPSGKFIAQYDKIHLVPFGEYVPWSSVFFFVEKISTGVGDYQPGRQVKVTRLVSGEKIGVFICYEAVMPDLVRRFVAEGAEVLVNITNDTWFGDSAAPHQHLMMARMRAVENHRYLLRAANSGISAVIDPVGRVLSRTKLDQRVVLDGKFYFKYTRTFYSQHGDLFSFLCLALSVSMVLFVILFRSYPVH